MTVKKKEKKKTKSVGSSVARKDYVDILDEEGIRK